MSSALKARNAKRVRDMYHRRLDAGECTLCGLPRDREGSKCTACVERYRGWRAGVRGWTVDAPAGDTLWIREYLREEIARVVAFVPSAVTVLDLDVEHPERMGGSLDRLAEIASAGFAILAVMQETARPGVLLSDVLALLELRASVAPPRRAASLRALAARLASAGAARCET